MLAPVRDADGQLIDWTIDLTAVLEHDPAIDAISEYRSWRRTWHREWSIGPISNVASLHDESGDIEYSADRHLDSVLELVVAADGADVVIAPTMAETIGRDIEAVRLALSVDDRMGTGVIDDMPIRSRSIGLARAWAPPRVDAVLAATPLTSVLIRPEEGMVLVHGEPGSATTFVGVTAVDMRGDVVLVMNDRGSSLRLSQSDARPLGWIVPRSLRWHLRPVPLVAVWTMLFDGLGAALRVSAERGVPVHVDSRSMTGHVPDPSDFPDV
jgi:hypothetical protein